MVAIRKSLTVLMFFGLLWLSAGPALATDNVLEQVPSGAWGVLVVKNLAETDAKLEQLRQQTRLPLTSPLEFLKHRAGIEEGLDPQGSALILVMPGEGADSPPAVLVLLPASDYAKLVKSLDAADPDARITQVQIEQRTYAVGRAGGYAAFAEPKDRAALEKALEPKKNLAGTLKVYQSWLLENDATIMVTAAGIQAISVWGQKGLDKAAEAAEKAPGPPEQQQQVRAALDIYRELFRAAEREVTATAVGIRLNPDSALQILQRTRLAPKGQLAQVLGGIEPREETAVSTLPAVPFVAAGGGVFTSRMSEALMEISVPMKGNAYGMTEEEAKQLTEMSKDMFPPLSGLAMMLGVGESGEPLYSKLVVVMRVDDAKAYLRKYDEFIERIGKELGRRDSVLSGIKAEEIEIDGRPALKIVMQKPRLPEGQNVPNFDQIMAAMFGPGETITGFLAAADECTLLAGYTDDAMLRRTLEVVSGNSGGLSTSKTVSKTAALLPKRASWVIYWSPRGTVELVKQGISAFVPGGLPGFQLPDFPETPPIGWAGVVTRNEFREHLVVPVAVLKAVGQYASKLQPGKVKEKAEP